jgi:hypothetical protein
MNERTESFVRLDRGDISMSWKIDCIKISCEALRVYIHLYRRAAHHTEHIAWPSVRSIGSECFHFLTNEDSQKRAARRAIEELEEVGMVKVTKRFDPETKSNQSNVYTVYPSDHYVPIAIRKGLAKKALVDYEAARGFSYCSTEQNGGGKNDTRVGQNPSVHGGKKVTTPSRKAGSKSHPLVTPVPPPTAEIGTTLVSESPPPLVTGLPPKGIDQYEGIDHEGIDHEDPDIPSYEGIADAPVSPSAESLETERDPWDEEARPEWTYDEYRAHGYHHEQIPFWSNKGRIWNGPLEPPCGISDPMPEPDPRFQTPEYKAMRKGMMERIAAEQAQEAQEPQKTLPSTPADPEPIPTTPATQESRMKMTKEEAIVGNLILDYGRFLATLPDLRYPNMPFTERERIKWLKVIQPYLRMYGTQTFPNAVRLARIMSFSYRQCVNNKDIPTRHRWYSPNVENVFSSRDHFNSVASEYASKYPNDDLDLGEWFRDIEGTAKRLKDRLKTNASEFERK